MSGATRRVSPRLARARARPHIGQTMRRPTAAAQYYFSSYRFHGFPPGTAVLCARLSRQ